MENNECKLQYFECSLINRCIFDVNMPKENKYTFENTFCVHMKNVSTNYQKPQKPSFIHRVPREDYFNVVTQGEQVIMIQMSNIFIHGS